MFILDILTNLRMLILKTGIFVNQYLRHNLGYKNTISRLSQVYFSSFNISTNIIAIIFCHYVQFTFSQGVATKGVLSENLFLEILQNS